MKVHWYEMSGFQDNIIDTFSLISDRSLVHVNAWYLSKQFNKNFSDLGLYLIIVKIVEQVKVNFIMTLC